MGMYCDQCQESVHGSGCTVRGVCGKDDMTAKLQLLNISCVQKEKRWPKELFIIILFRKCFPELSATLHLFELVLSWYYSTFSSKLSYFIPRFL